MAELLKGAPVARALTEELAARCVALREQGIVPTLAIVRVGEREDDLSYERGALKRCEKVGIEARRVLLSADVSQDELLAAIEGINTDSAVHGCLMFRPLPAGLDEDAVAAALDPAKDCLLYTSMRFRTRRMSRPFCVKRTRLSTGSGDGSQT